MSTQSAGPLPPPGASTFFSANHPGSTSHAQPAGLPQNSQTSPSQQPQELAQHQHPNQQHQAPAYSLPAISQTFQSQRPLPPSQPNHDREVRDSREVEIVEDTAARNSE
ncbi:hypothetical protein LTS18_002954, partial [Coniosporium uncinatum]